MEENMRQGDEKAKNLKQNLSTYLKRKEMAGDVTFTGGTETLIHRPERSSTHWNRSCNSRSKIGQRLKR